ncbi:hypothetical protein K402DRAFT_394825 [Aulographum hederae CBS 113979]|uniref:Uncharacterized protein n=1 Tax=Aulographum hederae CBS 113979 TaxID=1176131 RepID=A0A6G1GXN1_9PEZI|nr:hypothetical protein K402DRAFT_394825 [Aulographum hederae CBS 113979]
MAHLQLQAQWNALRPLLPSHNPEDNVKPAKRLLAYLKKNPETKSSRNLCVIALDWEKSAWHKVLCHWKATQPPTEGSSEIATRCRQEMAEIINYWQELNNDANMLEQYALDLLEETPMTQSEVPTCFHVLIERMKDSEKRRALIRMEREHAAVWGFVKVPDSVVPKDWHWWWGREDEPFHHLIEKLKQKKEENVAAEASPPSPLNSGPPSPCQR